MNNKTKIIITVLVLVLLGTGIFAYFSKNYSNEGAVLESSENFEKQEEGQMENTLDESEMEVVKEQEEKMEKSDSVSEIPMDSLKERLNKKDFGMLVNPATSPVQPERFAGFHTGADFEVFEDELTKDVPVKAICDGEIVLKSSIGGYGGVLIQSCELDGQNVTVVYGHLNLVSIEKNKGEEILKGEEIGLLGNHKSSQTDGERKHLHLGIHKGQGVELRGYVQSQAQLGQWIDPCSVLECEK